MASWPSWCANRPLVTGRPWSSPCGPTTPPSTPGSPPPIATPSPPPISTLPAAAHAADSDGEPPPCPLGPGLLAIGQGGLDVEADDHRPHDRASFVYDALYAWSARQVAAAST